MTLTVMRCLLIDQGANFVEQKYSVSKNSHIILNKNYKKTRFSRKIMYVYFDSILQNFENYNSMSLNISDSLLIYQNIFVPNMVHHFVNKVLENI